MKRIIAVAAVVSAAAVLLGPRPVAVTGGLLLAFVLPGLALLDVLRARFTTVERVMLVPALSMGALIVAGLVIHLVGLRIDRPAWTVATTVVTLAALAVERFRPAPVPVGAPVGAAAPLGEQRVRIDVGARTVRLPDVAGGDTVAMSIVAPEAAAPKPERGHLSRQLLPLVVVAALLVGAGWLSFDTSETTHDTAVTALSAQPSGAVDRAGNRTVRVTATGLTAADSPYTVSVTGAGGTETIKRTVTMTGDGEWRASLTMPGAQRMTVNLYRAKDTTAYRTLIVSAVD